MKIGLLIYGSLDTVSGGYLYDRRLVASLQALGHTLQVFSIPWRNYPAALTDNLTFRLPRGLDLLIQDELSHPSLILVNRRPHPCPVVSLVHHLRSSEEHPALKMPFYRSIERLYLRSVDGFIFNSQTTCQAVQALAGVSEPCVIALPPADRFGSGLSKAAVAARAKRPGALQLLFLGNLIPRKGLHTLLSALSGLPAGAVFLEAVGSATVDPAYVRQIREQIATLGLGASVRLDGFLADDLLQEKLANAHVLVVPSSYEGYGMAYLEGMAFGLPAIGTNAGAAGEIIRPGENGFLIDPGDAAALAIHLAALSTDRNLLLRLSLHALESYHLVNPWNQTAQAIHEFLSGFNKVVV